MPTLLIVISSAVARPGRRAALMQAATEMVRATRDSPGCLRYGFHADVEDEDVVVGVEVWISQEALDAHMEQPHTREFLAQVPELITGPADMVVHRVTEPA
ncbi:putative quinol monooxygenase [Streptomyces solaniscabiei]|uniref:putative quinol monooxygenase n=1 Tax=Streptomyces solaniscabiei TaxID=2683255 RepID=UPI001CE377CB|nr:putative quinol monooxygenase [Streptomyces solaniscabiei]